MTSAICNRPAKIGVQSFRRMLTKPPGVLLREFRDAAKMSAAELAEATGVPKDTIIAWERYPTRLNQSKPQHAESIEAIARVLNVSPSDIWGVAMSQVRDGRTEYGGDVLQEVAKFLLDLSFQEHGLSDIDRQTARDLLKRIIVTKSA